MESFLICALMFVNSYDMDAEVEFYNNKYDAEQSAINYYSDTYEKHFSSIEQIQQYNSFMLEQGVDGVYDVYIKCDRMKH